MTDVSPARISLLDAALRLFREKGYTATTVDDLCRAAGVTKGAFFHHFESKEAAALAAIAYWNETTAELFARAPYWQVEEPLQSLGLDAYRKTWDLFFRCGQPGPEVFVIDDLRVTAGSEVAFATGLLRIGGSPSPVCRLTLGLVKRDGQWLIAHEHHSAPHALEDQETSS